MDTFNSENFKHLYVLKEKLNCILYIMNIKESEKLMLSNSLRGISQTFKTKFKRSFPLMKRTGITIDDLKITSVLLQISIIVIQRNRMFLIKLKNSSVIVPLLLENGFLSRIEEFCLDIMTLKFDEVEFENEIQVIEIKVLKNIKIIRKVKIERLELNSNIFLFNLNSVLRRSSFVIPFDYDTFYLSERSHSSKIIIPSEKMEALKYFNPVVNASPRLELMDFLNSAEKLRCKTTLGFVDLVNWNSFKMVIYKGDRSILRMYSKYDLMIEFKPRDNCIRTIIEEINNLPLGYYSIDVSNNLHNVDKISFDEFYLSIKKEEFVVFNDPRYYNLREGINIIEDVRVASDFVEIFMLNTSFKIKTSEIRICKHEILQRMMFQSSSDIRFDQFFERLEDGFDHLTPDVIRKRNEYFMEVIELSTNVTEKLLQGSFKMKADKYLDHIKKRSEHHKLKVVFEIICVSPKKVLTNRHLSEDELSILSNLYPSFCYVRDKLVEEGIPEDLFTESLLNIETEMKILEKEFSNFPLNYNSKYIDLDLNCEFDERLSFLKANPVDFKKEIKNIVSTESEKIVEFRIVDSSEDVKTDKHPLTIFPYIIPEHTADLFPSMNNHDNLTSGLWSRISNYFDFEEYTKEEEVHDIAEVQELKNRNLWNKRVRIRRNKMIFPDIDIDKLQSFKEFGIILNKEIKRCEVALEYKKWQKRPFSLFTETDDIDNFINNFDGFQKRESFYSIISEIEDVTDYRINAGASYGTQQFNLFKNTEIGIYLDFLGDLMSEFSYSFKQFVKRNEMNVKKMKRFPVWIVTRPCGVKHPMWFSLLIHGDFHYCSIFRKCFPIGDDSKWYYTEFMSIKESRVGHYLNSLEIMFNTLVSLCIGWGIDVDDFLLKPESHPSIVKHFNLCFLIFLDSKQGTSSDFVNLRYYYMELMKGQLSYPSPNPFKIMKKMNVFKRSRMQVWLTKKMKEKGEMMLRNLPKLVNRFQKTELDSDENVYLTEELAVSSAFVMNDKWENLLSLIDDEKFVSSQQAIIFSYIGYLHNKDEISNSSDDFGIYEKIVKLEVLMKNLNQESMYCGEIDPEYHVFNAQFVKFGSKIFKSFLETETEYKEKFKEDYFKEIVYSSVDNMATFKASAPTELTNDEMTKDIEDSELRRPKLIERICEITEDFKGRNRSFYSELGNIAMPLYKGIKVFLFKKNQIGGTREIFILQAEARLLIYALETASRKLCNYVPFEMLTKGKIKKNWTKRHCVSQKSYLKSMKGRMCSVGNIYASGDCSTWCQNFTMRQFYIMLSEVMPENLLPLFKTILNLVTDKEIYLSKSVRKSFAEKPNTRSISPSINLLKDDWMGLGDNFIIDKMGCFIKNRSNMMQGILHFTSSLYHCMILTTLEVLLNHYTELYFPSVIIKVSKQVSSDDWGLIISIYLEKSRIVTKSIKIGNSFHKRKTYLLEYEKIGTKEILISNLIIQLQKVLYAITVKTYEQMGVVISEKSTFFSYNTVYEFNSNFEVNNSIIAPLIPIAYSAVDAKSFMNIESGIYIAQTLRSTCLENGMTLSSVSCIQSSQLNSHYRNLGLNTSVHSYKFVDLLLRNPTPSLGFFLKEPDALCGIAGLSFVKEHLYKKWLLFESTQDKLNYLCEYIPSEEGFLSQHFTIRQGLGESFIRFKKYISEIYSLDLDKEDFDPEILYEVFPSIDKGKIELSLKSCSVGAEENFIRKTQCSSHIAGVYMLNNPSVIGKFKIKNKKLESGVEFLDNSKSDLFKSSLIGFLKMLDKVKGKSKQNLMIQNPSFDIFNNVLNSFKSLSRYPKPFRLKSRILNIELIKNSTDFIIPLLDCCKSIWFNREVRISDIPINEVFTSYQRIIPWLRNTYQETLNDGPFENHSGLYGFLKSHHKKFTRKVSVLGGFVMKTSIEDTLISCSSLNFYQNYNVVMESTERVTSNLVSLISNLLINNRLPVFLREDISMILKKSKPIYEENDILTYVTLNSRFAELAVMQYVTKNPDVKNLIKCISLIKHGGILYYTQRQSFNPNLKSHYCGYGICKVFFEGTTAEIHIKGDSVFRIVMNKKSNSQNFYKFINSRSYQENWKMSSSLTYSGLRICKEGLVEDSKIGGISVTIDPSLSFDMHHNVQYFLSVDSRDRIRLHLEDELTRSKPVVLSCQLNKRFLELNSINPVDSSIKEFIESGKKYAKFKFKEICEILMDKEFLKRNFTEVNHIKKAEGLKEYMDVICREKLFNTEKFSVILRKLKLENQELQRQSLEFPEIMSDDLQDFDLEFNEEDNDFLSDLCNQQMDISNDEVVNDNLDFSDFVNEGLADQLLLFSDNFDEELEDNKLKIELMDRVGFMEGFNKARIKMKKTVSVITSEGVVTAWDQIKSGNYEEDENDVGSQFFTKYMFGGKKPDPIKVSSFF